MGRTKVLWSGVSRTKVLRYGCAAHGPRKSCATAALRMYSWRRSLDLPVAYRAAAYTAAPSSPASAFRITFTGIASMSASSGALSRNARMNAAVCQRRQDLRRDAAADEHAARCDRPERQVAGFGAVCLDEHLQRLDAAGATPIEGGCRNGRRCVGIARDRSMPRTGTRCVTRWMLTRPGPDTTCSTSARPNRSIRSRSSTISRSVRAAKSACPPSDGDGTKRPSTLWRSASPRPVPAAMSAMLPPRPSALPAARALPTSCSTGTAYAIACRSFSRLHAAHAERGGDALRVDAPRHVGQLGRRRRSPVRRRRSTPIRIAVPALVASSSRNAAIIDGRSSKSSVVKRARRSAADAPRPDRTARAASWCRRCRRRAARQLELSAQCSMIFAIDIRLILLHLEAVPQRSVGAEAVCPHPRLTCRIASPLAGQLVVFTGKLSSLGRKDARALVVAPRRRHGRRVNARTTMLVVGAEGSGPRDPDRPEKQQAEAGRGA